MIAALGISVSDSNARVKAAGEFGTLRQLDGRITEPRHPHTAAGQAEGTINTEKAHRIGLILRKLPRGLDRDVYEAAEQTLADAAASCTPEDLSKVGALLLAHLDPDGKLSDEKDRKRLRGISIGEQQGDLMSRISGWIDPELRAFLDAILAKFARPGMNNPEGAPRGAVNHIGGERLRSDCVAA